MGEYRISFQTNAMGDVLGRGLLLLLLLMLLLGGNLSFLLFYFLSDGISSGGQSSRFLLHSL